MADNLKQKFLPDEYIFKQGEKGKKAYLLLILHKMCFLHIRKILHLELEYSPLRPKKLTAYHNQSIIKILIYNNFLFFSI